MADVVYVSIYNPSTRWPAGLIIIIAGFAFSLVVTLLTVMFVDDPSPFIALVLVVLGAAVFLALLSLLTRMRTERRAIAEFREEIETWAPDLRKSMSLMFLDLNAGRPPLFPGDYQNGTRSWIVLENERDLRAIPRVSTVADDTLRDALSGIDRPDRPLDSRQSLMNNPG